VNGAVEPHGGLLPLRSTQHDDLSMPELEAFINNTVPGKAVFPFTLGLRIVLTRLRTSAVSLSTSHFHNVHFNLVIPWLHDVSFNNLALLWLERRAIAKSSIRHYYWRQDTSRRQTGSSPSTYHDNMQYGWLFDHFAT